MTHRNFSAAVILSYWTTFWIMNGLDKVMSGVDLGLFNWHGKERYDQFGGYFANMELPAELVQPVLSFAFVWEVGIGLLLAFGLLSVLLNRYRALADRFLLYGFSLSGLTFVGFSVFDVVSGDRRELFEHAVYMGLLLMSWTFLVSETRNADGGNNAS